MDDEAVKNHPSFREAEQIVRDKSHPQHERFWNGDRAVNEHVQGLYREADSRTFGNDDDAQMARMHPELGQVSANPTGAPVDQQSEADPAGAESPVVVATRAQLEWAWGKDFDTNMSELAGAVVERLGSVDALDNIAEKLGIVDDPEARAEGLKYLYKHVLKRR